MNFFAPSPVLAQASAWPFVVLAISVGFIVIAITKLRMHAFVALICAALLAGWLTSGGDLSRMVGAIGQVSAGFGSTAAGVGLVIALAAIIGMCLMDSGAADQIVRRFMKIFGEKRAGWALMASGFLLSIPVFFDTVFFLLIPLARMLAIRTGKNYMFYVLAIGGGGAITHSIVPPTPGPLLVGDMLGIDLGKLIIAGIAAGLLPAMVSLWYSRRIDERMPVPVRETVGSNLKDLKASTERPDSELPPFWASLLPVILPAVLLAGFSVIDLVEKQPVRTEFNRELRQDLAALPPVPADVVEALEPVFVGVTANVPMNSPATKAAVTAQAVRGLAIVRELHPAAATAEDPELFAERVLYALAQERDGQAGGVPIAGAVAGGLLEYEITHPSNFSALHGIMKFLGDKVVALGAGALIAMLLLMRQARLSFRSVSEKCTGPLETAATIILITSAGGAFGVMIQNTGIGEAIKALGGGGGMQMLFVAWLVTAIIRIAQGSATVSMITGAGLMAAIIGDGSGLPFDPVYIFLAVGFGSITCSWMNDSGFWIVGKLSGFTEQETLKSWTVLLTIIAVVGLLQSLLLASVIPFPFGRP